MNERELCIFSKYKPCLLFPASPTANYCKLIILQLLCQILETTLGIRFFLQPNYHPRRIPRAAVNEWNRYLFRFVGFGWVFFYLFCFVLLRRWEDMKKNELQDMPSQETQFSRTWKTNIWESFLKDLLGELLYVAWNWENQELLEEEFLGNRLFQRRNLPEGLIRSRLRHVAELSGLEKVSRELGTELVVHKWSARTKAAHCSLEFKYCLTVRARWRVKCQHSLPEVQYWIKAASSEALYVYKNSHPVWGHKVVAKGRFLQRRDPQGSSMAQVPLVAGRGGNSASLGRCWSH